MHFLLIRFSSLGDVVMQTSTASWIKQNFPNAHITFITSKEFKSLVNNHPHIDSIKGYERQKGIKDLISLRNFVRSIHQDKPIDFIIDLHGTTRSFMIKLLNPDIPCLNLDKRRIERVLLVKLKLDLLKNEKVLHERVIDDYQSFFNKKYDRNDLENFIEERNQVKGSLTSAPESFVDNSSNQYRPFKNYIVIAPVASFTPKRWPEQNFKELCIKFLEDKELQEYSIALVAGPKDDYVDIFDELEQRFPNRFVNYKGKTNLAQSSQVIRNSKLLLGNDTGMGHIAESYGIDVISIFGPTSESFGFRPHRSNSESISFDLWCRPCSTTGKKKCFRSKQYCMENVTIDYVLNKLRVRLVG